MTRAKTRSYFSNSYYCCKL